MWQTSLVCRVGLLWIAILVSRLSLLLYEWPAWIFGVCFIIWMDAGATCCARSSCARAWWATRKTRRPAA